MINILTSVNNDKEKQQKHNGQVDIKTIISNAKMDKKFHKLLSLCIKYDIHLFNQIDDVCTLFSVENLIEQSNNKQRSLTEELAKKIELISKNGPTNTWLLDIDNLYIHYKKQLKDMEIIDYVLKNIYNDDKTLEQLCCTKHILSSSSNDSQTNIPIKQNDKTKSKKETQSKYIAVYSN